MNWYVKGMSICFDSFLPSKKAEKIIRPILTYADEAHRLTEKTKVSFMFYGENQIKEIIHASKVSVFFIDETQQIDIKDFGTIENIKRVALEEGAEVIEDERFVLKSQFRCNGSR